MHWQRQFGFTVCIICKGEFEWEYFFTADLHFDDKNIILYENRPFENVNEMNNKLVENWNSVVSINDEVYVVGDFGGNGREENILSMLNGVKYIVKGNHDIRSNEYYRQVGFRNCWEIS